MSAPPPFGTGDSLRALAALVWIGLAYTAAVLLLGFALACGWRYLTGTEQRLAAQLETCEADLMEAAARLRGPNVPPARINATSTPPVGLEDR